MSGMKRDCRMVEALRYDGLLPWLLAGLGLLTLGCGEAPQDGAGSSPIEVTHSQAQPPSDKPLAALGSRIEAGAYRFLADGAGFRAQSLEERLKARFDQLGVHISAKTASESAGEDEVSLRFAAWGRVGGEREIAPVEPVLGDCNDANRVDERGECVKRLERRYDGLVEWWDNTSRGLQQAWVIADRPGGAGLIQLLVDVEGAAVSTSAGNAVLLRRDDGSILDYDELHIVDADGKVLEGTLRAEAGRILISFDDDGARYPVTVDPIVSSLWSPSVTPQEQAYFGLPMTGLGDVNGDAIDDFAIGGHGYHGAQVSSGKVFVFSKNHFDSAPHLVWEKSGTQAFGGFGYAVSGGDFNGDGYGDLLVSEPIYSKVYVFFGSSTGLGFSAGWSAGSGVADDGFGMSVASAGDVNGDGRSDILVGAPFASAPVAEEGKVYLYLGASSAMSTTPVWTRRGNQVGQHLGFSVAGVGDVNGDGRSDVVVGGPGGGTGRAWGYLGTASGLGNASWSPAGTQSGEAFGNNVAAAGDENGDGYADVLIGAPGYDAAGKVDAGRLFIYSGGPSGFGASSTTAEGANAGDQLGLEVSGAGDINGDGKADALIGGNGASAGVRYGRGTYPAEPDDFSAAVAETTAGVGDVDGDGFADAAFGDPWANNNSGTATLANGGPIFPPNAAIDGTLTDGDATSQFGNAVSDAGDVNGDGYSDLLVGANQRGGGVGKAFLYFGNDALPTQPIWSDPGSQVNAHFGSAFAGCDFDNDGYSDIAVSQPERDVDQVDEGRVVLYYGGAAGISAGPFTISADQADARFGTALAAGDVNGDGYCDLAVGAPLHDNGQTDEGRVYIYRGASTRLASTPTQTLENNVAGSLFGSALSVGDATRDGRKDLAVGAKGYSSGQAGEGRVYVYFADSSGVFGGPAWGEESNIAGAGFGTALSMDADFDEDGDVDLAVGAPGTGSAAGQVYWYSRTATGFVLGGQFSGSPGDGSVVATGDANGDGFGDLAYAASSSVTVKFGGPNGIYPAYGGFGRSPGGGESALGRSLSLRGDLNGDGTSDLSAGLMLASSGGVKTWRLEKGGVRLQVLRAGTNIPIAPGGLSPSNDVDVRLFARTPYGRMRAKLYVAILPCGGGYQFFSPTWTDTGVAGTWLTVPVRNLPSGPYSYRVRILYEPILGFGPTHSRWYYGGNKGDTSCGAHFRSP